MRINCVKNTDKIVLDEHNKLIECTIPSYEVSVDNKFDGDDIVTGFKFELVESTHLSCLMLANYSIKIDGLVKIKIQK